MKALAAALVVALVLTVAACGGDDAPLKNANDARATATVTAIAGALDIGKPGTIQDSTAVVEAVTYKTLSEMASVKPSETGVEWALVSVRVENRSQKPVQMDFKITCADGSASHRYSYDAADSFDPANPIPPGSFSEGTMLFSMPPTCKGAGSITASPNVLQYTGTKPVAPSWKLPS